LVAVITGTVKVIFSRKNRTRVLKYEESIEPEDKRVPESAKWLNDFAEKLWDNYSIYAGEQIMAQVGPILQANKPPQLSDIKLESIDLGDECPDFNNMNIIKSSDPNELIFDVDLYWDSPFFSIVVAVKYGVWASIKIGNFKISAKARIKAKLVPQPPFASWVQVQLLEPPQYDLDVKPMSSGPDLLELPGLSQMIRVVVNSVLGDMLVAPKSLQVDLIPKTTDANGPKKTGLAFKPMDGEGNAVADSFVSGLSSIGGMGSSAVDGVGKAFGAVGDGAMGAVGGVGKAFGGLVSHKSPSS